MTKHGICLHSNKRNFGKGRKKKPIENTKRFMGSWLWPDKITRHARDYRTWNQSSRGGMSSPSRRRVIGNRRRARKNMRKGARHLQREVKEEADAKKHEVEKMEKFHAKQARQMRKRFLRDIHNLLEQQAKELENLKSF